MALEGNERFRRKRFVNNFAIQVLIEFPCSVFCSHLLHTRRPRTNSALYITTAYLLLFIFVIFISFFFVIMNFIYDFNTMKHTIMLRHIF